MREKADIGSGRRTSCVSTSLFMLPALAIMTNAAAPPTFDILPSMNLEVVV